MIMACDLCGWWGRFDSSKVCMRMPEFKTVIFSARYAVGMLVLEIVALSFAIGFVGQRMGFVSSLFFGFLHAALSLMIAVPVAAGAVVAGEVIPMKMRNAYACLLHIANVAVFAMLGMMAFLAWRDASIGNRFQMFVADPKPLDTILISQRGYAGIGIPDGYWNIVFVSPTDAVVGIANKKGMGIPAEDNLFIKRRAFEINRLTDDQVERVFVRYSKAYNESLIMTKTQTCIYTRMW